MTLKRSILANITLLILSAVFFNCASDQSANKSQKIIDFSKVPPIDKYRVEVAYQVNKNWKFPKNSECYGDIQTGLVFSILPNGEIREIFFHKKSNCKDLDDSAYSAIIRAAPFKPFSNELDAAIAELGLWFSPEGVK